MRIWSPMTSAANSASGPIHLKFIVSAPRLIRAFPFIALHNERAGVKPAHLLRLIPDVFGERVLAETGLEKEPT
jgi:hypothetical protein